MEPYFTIITPTYNKRPLSLQRCCKSIDQQTFTNYEHIIAYQEEEYLKIPGRPSIIVKNCTEYGNKQRNEAIQHIKGKYTIFLDDDNILYPHALDSIHKVITDQTDVIYSSVIHVQNNKIFKPGNFKPSSIDLLNWCIATYLVQKTPYPLYGYAADWNYFNEIIIKHKVINIQKGNLNSTINITDNHTVIGIHLAPLDQDL